VPGRIAYFLVAIKAETLDSYHSGCLRLISAFAALVEPLQSEALTNVNALQKGREANVVASAIRRPRSTIPVCHVDLTRGKISVGNAGKGLLRGANRYPLSGLILAFACSDFTWTIHVIQSAV
jgi:hypothetical protein